MVNNISDVWGRQASLENVWLTPVYKNAVLKHKKVS